MSQRSLWWAKGLFGEAKVFVVSQRSLWWAKGLCGEPKVFRCMYLLVQRGECGQEAVTVWLFSSSAIISLPLCFLIMHFHYIYEQSKNHISLINRPRCYPKSPTAQDAVQPIHSWTISEAHLLEKKKVRGYTHSDLGLSAVVSAVETLCTSYLSNQLWILPW